MSSKSRSKSKSKPKSKPQSNSNSNSNSKSNYKSNSKVAALPSLSASSAVPPGTRTGRPYHFNPSSSATSEVVDALPTLSASSAVPPGTRSGLQFQLLPPPPYDSASASASDFSSDDDYEPEYDPVVQALQFHEGFVQCLQDFFDSPLRLRISIPPDSLPSVPPPLSYGHLAPLYEKLMAQTLELETSLLCAQAEIASLKSAAPAQVPVPPAGAPDVAAVQAPDPPAGVPDVAAVQAPDPPAGAPDVAAVQAPDPPAGVPDVTAVQAPDPPAGAPDVAAVQAPDPPAGADVAAVQAPDPPAGAPDVAAVQAPDPPAGVPDVATVQAPDPPAGAPDVAANSSSTNSLSAFATSLSTTSITLPNPTSSLLTAPTVPPHPNLARKPRRRRRGKRSKPTSLPNSTILQPPLYYYSSDFLAYCPMGPGHHSFAWVEALRCWSSPRFYSFPPLLEVPSTAYSPPKPPQLTVPRFAPVR